MTELPSKVKGLVFFGFPLLGPVLTRLGDIATLGIIQGADHSFHVPKSSGKNDGQVLAELARSVSGWASGLA